VSKVAVVMYDGVSLMVKKILEEGWVRLTHGMRPRVLHNTSRVRLLAFQTTRLRILWEYLRRKELSERETQVSVSTT